MNNFNKLRKELDKIDEKTLELIALRQQIIKLIAYNKQQSGLNLTDKKREEELRKIWSCQAEKLGLEKDIALRILELILISSKKTQQNIITK